IIDVPTAEHQATQIAAVPQEETQDGTETRYTRGPTRTPSAEDLAQRAGVDVETEHHIAAHVGESRVSTHFRDDEMTVMMDAPPRARSADPRARRAAERGAERGAHRGAGRGSDRGADRGSDRSADRGSDRSADRGSDRGAERGSDRGADRGSDRDPDRADRGV